MKEFIFTWSIQNVSYSWHKTGQEIVSQKFLARPINCSSWTLRLYPRGIENSDYLSLYLRRENDGCPDNIAVNFELSCITADTSAALSCFIPESFNFFAKADVFGVVRFLRRHEVFGSRKAMYLPHDTLTLRCRMWEDIEGDDFGQLSVRTILTIKREIMNTQYIPKVSTCTRTAFFTTIMKNLLSVSLWFPKNSLNLEIHDIQSLEMRSTTLCVSLVDKRIGKILCEHLSVWLDGPQNEQFRLPLSGTLQRERDDNQTESDFEITIEVIYSTGEKTEVPETIRDLFFPTKYLSNYIDGHPRVSEDLWKFFLQQTHCDVKLKANDGSIFAHKVILCARSSIFLVMLTDQMNEKKNGFIEMEDISARTLKKFLAFLYTDAFENLKLDEVIELYYAADKYQIQLLRFLCSSYLMKNIKVDNVRKILIVADQHGDSDLKRQIYKFILKNEERVFASDQWKTFSDENSAPAVKSMLRKYEIEGKFPN